MCSQYSRSEAQQFAADKPKHTQTNLDTPIFQPGLLDGGNPTTDQVAALTRFIPLVLAAPNLVDCAIARILDPAQASPVFPPNVDRLPSAAPAIGMNVEKVGRTTGYTQGTTGKILAIDGVSGIGAIADGG